MFDIASGATATQPISTIQPEIKANKAMRLSGKHMTFPKYVATDQFGTETLVMTALVEDIQAASGISFLRNTLSQYGASTIFTSGARIALFSLAGEVTYRLSGTAIAVGTAIPANLRAGMLVFEMVNQGGSSIYLNAKFIDSQNPLNVIALGTIGVQAFVGQLPLTVDSFGYYYNFAGTTNQAEGTYEISIFDNHLSFFTNQFYLDYYNATKGNYGL